MNARPSAGDAGHRNDLAAAAVQALMCPAKISGTAGVPGGGTHQLKSDHVASCGALGTETAAAL
jgi:hypothetical protein